MEFVLARDTYEALPYLYMGSGALVAFGLSNAWGIFSGIMLISAGVNVWHMSRRHWQLMQHRQDQRAWKAAKKQKLMQQSQFVHLAWRKEYECGNSVIDTRHRNLFALGNTLLNAIMGSETKLDVELLFDELIEKVATHFKTEEALLGQVHHPSTAAHCAAHARLLARSKELAERYHRGELSRAIYSTLSPGKSWCSTSSKRIWARIITLRRKG